MQMPTFCSKYWPTKAYTLVIFCIIVKVFNHSGAKLIKCYYLNCIFQLPSCCIDCDAFCVVTLLLNFDKSTAREKVGWCYEFFACQLQLEFVESRWYFVSIWLHTDYCLLFILKIQVCKRDRSIILIQFKLLLYLLKRIWFFQWKGNFSKCGTFICFLFYYFLLGLIFSLFLACLNLFWYFYFISFLNWCFLFFLLDICICRWSVTCYRH